MLLLFPAWSLRKIAISNLKVKLTKCLISLKETNSLFPLNLKKSLIVWPVPYLWTAFFFFFIMNTERKRQYSLQIDIALELSYSHMMGVKRALIFYLLMIGWSSGIYKFLTNLYTDLKIQDTSEANSQFNIT